MYKRVKFAEILKINFLAYFLYVSQYNGCLKHAANKNPRKRTGRMKLMGIKPGPKRIAKSTGMPDRRQRDNKNTPGNTPTLKPHNHKKGD